MTQITVSVKGARGLRAVLHGVLSAAAIGFLAWHGGSAPADALGVAVAAGYGHLTAYRPPSRPAAIRRPQKTKGRRRG